MAARNAAIVSTQWLKQQMTSSVRNLCVLDSTWSFTKSGHEDYLRKHVPGAGFFDLNRCITPTQHIPRSLPDPQCFEDYVQELGINQEDQLVIYDQSGTLPSARAWWQFRMYGHSNVSVLDGGLNKWEKEGYQLSAEAPVDDKKGNYKVELHKELMKTFDDVILASKTESHQILDARSPKYFKGEGQEPSPPTQTALKTANLKEASDMSRGHLPGAINFRTSLIIDPETGLFYSPAEIRENFQKAGVDLSRPMTTMCYNGMAACLLACGAAVAGKEDTAVYFGSWTEFGQRASQSECAIDETSTRHSG